MARRTTNQGPTSPPLHTGNPAAGLDHGPGDAPLSGVPVGSGPGGPTDVLGGPGASFSSPSGPSGEERTAAQKAKDEARHLVDDAKRQTGKLASQARDQVQGLVVERKDQMAQRLGSIAGALRDVGHRLNEEDGGGLGRYADRAAAQVDRLSTYLRDRDLTSFVSDAETFARRRPELFLGGTFLAGVLLARFLKASSERQQERRYSDVNRLGGSPYDENHYEGPGEPWAGAPEPYNPVGG